MSGNSKIKHVEAPPAADAPIWTADFDWPFGNPPPTRDYLASQGLDPDAMHLLGLNEAPLAPPASVQEAVAAAAQYLNRYPDNVHSGLVHAVAKRCLTAPDLQVWGSGAGELIYRAVAIAARQGLHIVSPSPTFWGYERVYALCNADVTRTRLHSDGRLDVDSLLGAITERTGIVTFATPGNPSGVRPERRGNRTCRPPDASRRSADGGRSLPRVLRLRWRPGRA